MNSIRWMWTGFLVVTFTNAAASEMRERIGDAIEAALEREPENHHLQRQQSLIHNAQITTIDSFLSLYRAKLFPYD